jgi:hypothetical protein
MTRDSLGLWLGIVGGILGVLVAQLDALPLSPQAKTWITIIASLVATISGKLATSPLPGAPKG